MTRCSSLRFICVVAGGPRGDARCSACAARSFAGDRLDTTTVPGAPGADGSKHLTAPEGPAADPAGHGADAAGVGDADAG